MVQDLRGNAVAIECGTSRCRPKRRVIKQRPDLSFVSSEGTWI